MPTPKIKSIYNALKGGGADVGTEQEFNNWFLAKGDQGYKNRKYVWDTMREGGADVGANYEEFRDWLGLKAVKPQPTEQRQPKSTLEMAQEVGFGKFNANTAGLSPFQQEQKKNARTINPVTGKPVEEEEQPMSIIPKTPEQQKKAKEYGQQLKDEFQYAKETGGKRLQDNNLLNLPGQVNTVARDAQGDILKNENGDVIKGVTTDESKVLASERHNDVVDKLELEDTNFKELRKVIDFKLDDVVKNGKVGNYEGFDKLVIAKKALDDAESLRDEIIKQRRSGSVGDFFRNMWRSLKSENMFSVAEDLVDNVHVKSAADKYTNNPESLTDAEKILLDAVAFKSVMQQEYEPQMSRSAKAGQTTGGSISLMAEIAMNPLSGLGKSLAKTVGKQVLKNAAKKAAEKGATRAISQGTARTARVAAAAGNIVGNVGSAAGMTATIGSPRVISDAQQRMIGDIQSEYDENGLLRFKGVEGGDNAFDAYRKAFTATAIENFTEIQSSMLLGAVGLAGRTIPGVRSALNGFKATKLGQMWNAAGRSQLGSMARNVAQRTGLHDFPGESLEEIEGGILNALFVGDQTIADTFEQDNLIDIGLGVAPMQMFFGAVNLGGYGMASRKAKSALRSADSNANSLFGSDKWGALKATIDGTKDVNELKSVMSNVIRGGQYSTQQKQAAFNYAAAREGYKGAVLGEAAARELDFGKQSRVNSFSVDDKTVTTFDKDGNELGKKTFNTDDEVQGYMTELKMRRANDDMLNDIATVQQKGTKRDAMKGDAAYTTLFSENEWAGLVSEAMHAAGYDESRGENDPMNQAIAANVLQPGTAENDILKDLTQNYNPLQRLHHNIAETYGISDGELQRILDKDPMKRTDEQQKIVDDYAAQLHQLAYQPGELHTEQSAQDGATAADDADNGAAGMNPEALRAEKERYDAAIAARDEALKRNQAMAMRIEELQAYGVDPAGIVAELSDYDDEDVKAIVEGYNAEYRWQSFLDKANQNFEETTKREVARRTFKGTLNGAAQSDNLLNVTDGENTYTLVAGDVTTDADGRVTSGGNANALVAINENGDMVVLHPESTLSVAQGGTLADFGAAFLQTLQEQGSAAVAPAEETEGAAGGAATESPQTEQGAEGVPAEGAPVGEQPAGEQTPRLVKTWTTKNGRKVELFVMPEEVDEWGNRHVKIGRSVDGGEIEATSVNGIEIPEDIIDYETTFGDVDLALENENNFRATEVIYLSDGRIKANGTINGDKSSFWLKSDPLAKLSEGNENVEQPSEGEGEQPTIPTNEKGRKLYHQGVDLDVAIDDILAGEEGDNDPMALANRRIKTAQKKLEELNKGANKALAKQFESQDFDDDEFDDIQAIKKGQPLPYNTKLGQYAQQRMEYETIISYYNKLKNRYAARQAAQILAGEGAASTEATEKTEGTEQPVVEPAGEANVPDWTVDKASDARARGYRMENGHRVDRHEPIAGKHEGNDVEVKFDKAEEPVKGKWTVLDTVDTPLVPSHVNGQRNVEYFLTEAQPKERTDADSDNSSTAIAEHITPEEITNGVTAYTGAPVVNTRGEVIQGNNRTIGLQKMWGNDAYGESQAAYRQYLMDHAADFGLDAKEIETMENPVLVRMVDVSDDEAIRLGQKTAANTESGGIERIDAGRVLNQMGDNYNTFVRLLFSGAEEEDQTLMGFIVKNGVQVLKWLNDGRNHAKYITDTEYQSCFDKKGNLTEEAKQDIQKIVEGMLFADAPDNLRDMFYRMPAKAQNAILATFYRDAQSPKESSIIKDIQNAIEAFETISNASPEFKAAKVVNEARVAVKDVQKQTAMFGNTGTILEKFDNFAIELAILFKGAKQNTIRDYFNTYYDAVQGKGGGLFEEAVVKTKAQAVKDIFGIDINENNEENGSEGSIPLESGSNNGTGGESGNAGESGVGKPVAQGEQPAVGGGGTAGTSEEVSAREKYIAEHPLTEAEIDASDAPKMRKSLAKQYLNGTNETTLAQAAYTSIYNKKAAASNANNGSNEGNGETINFNIDEIKELENAPRSVRETIKDDAVPAYHSAQLKVPVFQFGVPEEQQERMTYEKFHDEFIEKVGEYLGKPCEPYLKAVYDYIQKKLEEAYNVRKAKQQAAQEAAIESQPTGQEKPAKTAPNGTGTSVQNSAQAAAQAKVNAILARMKQHAKKEDVQQDISDNNEASESLSGTIQEKLDTVVDWLKNIIKESGSKIKSKKSYIIITDKDLTALINEYPEYTEILRDEAGQMLTDGKTIGAYVRGADITIYFPLNAVRQNKNKGGMRGTFYHENVHPILNEMSDEEIANIANGLREEFPLLGEVIDKWYKDASEEIRNKEVVCRMFNYLIEQYGEDAVLDGDFEIDETNKKNIVNIINTLRYGTIEQKTDEGLEPGRNGILAERNARSGNIGKRRGTKQDVQRRVKSILSRIKRHGRNSNIDAYSIAGLTAEQMDDMLELIEAGAELGYTLLDGVETKEAWKEQMRGMIGEQLKDATGYTDAEVDELLEDLWNAPFEQDGQEKTVAEWAAEKGIVINENSNDNGTEEGNGTSNAPQGESGGNTVGGSIEVGVGEEIPNNEGDTGNGGETGVGTVAAGGSRGNGSRGSSTGTRQSSGSVGTSVGSTGRGKANSGASNEGGQTNVGGGTVAAGEQPAVSAGAASVGQPERVVPKQPLADVSKEKAPYVPASIGGKHAIGSVVPSGVADAIAQAFKRLREQHKKEILDFVRDELGYSSNEEMLSDFDSGKTDGLAAEQVDAVALAISAMKSGKSFIVGDMTGVGKGRTAAALIRWGKKQGKKVIFITEKSGLFSDMYRDLTDIGCDYMPFVTNNDTDANITDADGNKVIPKPSPSAQSALWQREDDELPADKKGRKYDFVMTTYSQASNPRGANAKNKLEWLQRYAKDAIVIMDESHNASGESNRGEYFKDIVKASGGVTFLSATYAKRPDNMLLYALRSSMSETHMSTGDMLEAIKEYGVPMQEMMAAALYGSGEMIRRERDMSDVKTTWTDPKVIYSEEEYEQCRKTSDKTMDLVNDIIDFQRDYVNPIVKAHEEQYENANAIAALAGAPQTHATNTAYSSQVSNIVGLMVYSMKAKKAAQMAIEQIKQGKKPVIAVENTFGSYIDELGNEIDNANFGPIFEKGVKFSLKYTIAKYIKKEGKYEKDKESEQVFDAENELDEDGIRALNSLRLRVQAYLADNDKIDLTLSPIDLIKQMIADAGYNCGEITGRSYQLERKPGGGYLKTPFKTKKKDAARKFNGGAKERPLPEKEQYQALVVNVAGATGISLHSSKTFGNQQPRTMIILQPARDVNTEVQMRGRIDRTGQVHRGEYFYVTSPVPAEQKLTMMLKQKLASLDAQSVGTKDVSSNKVESQDMDNKYGDEVCYQFLLEHLQDVNSFLENGLKYNNKTREWEGRPGLLYDVLKNIQRLSCSMQEMVINELTQRYQDQIDYLNQNGINDLETTTKNLEAVTIDKATFVKGKDNESVNEFAHDTTIERVEVNVLKKPMRSSDIKKKMKDLDTLDDDGLPKQGVLGEVNTIISDKVSEKYEERKAKFEEREQKLEEKIRKEHPKKDEQTDEEWEQMIQSWPTLQELRMKNKADLNQYATDLQNQKNAVYKAAMYLNPGRPYLVPLTDDVSSNSMSMYGRFLGFQMKNGDPRQVQAVFAVKDSRSMISIPIVNQKKVIDKIIADRGDFEITALERDKWGDNLRMEEKAKKWDEWWDKMIPKNTSRQIRYMITGNVLQACGSLGKYKGQIVTFTRKNKDTGEITLERGMLLAENFDPEDFRVRRAVTKKDVWEHYNEIEDEKSGISCSRQGDNMIVKFKKRKGEKLVDHPAQKDEVLKSLAMNNEIRPSGKTEIDCVIKEANVEKVLEHLYKEYGYTKEELFVMPDSTEKPDAIVRTNRSYQEIIDEFSPKYGSEWGVDGKIRQMLKRYRMDVNNDGLKQEIREAVQLRQAYLRKRYARKESNRLAWQVLIEDELIEKYKEEKDLREHHMRIREAILEELDYRNFKGTALHLEQGTMTLDDVRKLFEQLNNPDTEEGKAKAALFEKVFEKVSKLPMEIFLNEKINNDTGGFAGGRVINYNWKYMNADYIADQAKADTILHELIHTVTAYADRCVDDGLEHLLDADMVDAINELKSIHSIIQNDPTFIHDGEPAYGTTNVREMLSEAGSNSEFREDLKKTNLWQKMWSGILKFFGIKQNVTGGKQVNALEAVLFRLDYLIENFNQKAWEEYYKGTRYGGYGYKKMDAQKVAMTSQQTEQAKREESIEQDGLRKAVGDEAYRKYMRDLWMKPTAEMREWVRDHLPENGFDLYTTIDKYLKQAAEKGEGSQEMWQGVRDGLKEATGQKRMSLFEARWLSWLNGRKMDKNNPSDSMKRSAMKWRIGRRRDIAKHSVDGQRYAGINIDDDLTEKMAFGNTASSNLARMWYHDQINSWSNQWTEAHIDYAVSLKKLLQAMSGDENIFNIPDDENAYVAENHISSIVSQKEFQFMRDHWQPLQDAIDACLPDIDSDVQSAMDALEDYLRAKHGLERNREFFVRDWLTAMDKMQQKTNPQNPIDVEQLRQDWELEKQTAWSRLKAGRMTYRQYLETLDKFIKDNLDDDWDASLLKNDKSGLRNYASQTKDAFDEDEVLGDIEDIENALGDKADNLWKAINDVTDYSLNEDYQNGVISKQNRDHVSGMFHFYVPLRGFNEKVANEVYDYMNIRVSNPVGLASLMAAKGRKSLSDSPLAVMGAMATSAITRGQRNLVKQKLLRFVRNRYSVADKNRLVSLSKIWIENIGTEDNPIWEERWPEFDENDSADEIARKVADFNRDMEQKRAAGTAMPRRANLNIPYRAKDSEKKQHMVEARENGESYLIIINGDPRAAQAMNGMLNPSNADKNHSLGLLKNVLSSANRFLSSAFTTWNPTFVVRNTIRDAVMSRSTVLAKEGEGYLMRFRKNYWSIIYPELINGRLWKKYRNGTLDDSNFLERCFKEFMENGGETGYVELKNVDKWRKMILEGSKTSAVRSGRGIRKAAYSVDQFTKAAIGLVEDYNERAENLARFATFLTSREMGRSVLRCVADAKDVSVNFNRKGAGGSTADKNYFAGISAEVFRSCYLFYNAGIQSLALMGRNIKNHPLRFVTAQFGNHFVMGVMMPFINQMLVAALGDDDTAENPYANLPEWVRRNNLCFFVGGNNFVTIPLPIELRAFYGLGDIAAGYFIDKELKSLKSPAEDIAAQITQILPVDFMGEGGDLLAALTPDLIKPLAQVRSNRDWTGKPIQRESQWNEYDPEWTKAYRSENKVAVNIARTLSNATGGDDVVPGLIDISPAYAIHLIKGYTGGMGQTVMEATGLARDLAKFDFEDFNMRNVPLAKAVYNQSDDRTAFYRTRAKFYKYAEEVEKSKHYLSGYKKTAEDPEMRAKMIQMMRRDEYKNAVMDAAQKELKKIQKAMNQAPDSHTRKQLESQQYRIQEQTVKMLEAV